MTNLEIGAARSYHNATKHTQESVRSGTHVLDYENMPLPYKIYPSLHPIPLPSQFPLSEMSALEAVAASSVPAPGEAVPSLQDLARLCFFSNGVTKRIRRGDWEIDFRAAACTGALYHVELYLACTDVPGLAAGVYHYGAHDNSLRQLRSGDFRQVLVRATGEEESLAHAPVIAIYTSTFWRNAWKYRARAYRHTFWDGGTILANLLAEAAAIELPAKLILGFADEPVNRLLDVDGRREAAIGIVALGQGEHVPRPVRPVPPLRLATVPLSPHEVEYPEIPDMHAAGSLRSADEAASWREARLDLALPEPASPVVPLRPLDAAALPTDPLEPVIRRRGSTRRFTRDAIPLTALSTMLSRAVRGIVMDCLDAANGFLGDAYVIVNAVDGLDSGLYVLHPRDHVLEMLRPGSYRDEAGRLALGQDLGADAAVNIYFMIGLEPVLAAFGNRGYRLAQLSSAITAGRLYVTAYALRLGATGLTFFDDDVTEFFSPHGAGKSVMFLMALGQPAK